MENQEQARERFSKRLTQNEVEKCIILFPLAAVAGIFEFQEGLLFCIDVMDNLGKAWSFLGKFHINEEMGNYVSISWPQFSTEKGLKANDEVTFVERPQREGDNGGTWKKFKVEIKRKIRLFGQDIWGELMV